MWWANSLCTSANEDLGTLAEYDPLTRSDTNKIAEHAARRVKEGTSAGGEKRWNASARGEPYKTDWHTVSHRFQEDV